MDFKVIKTIFKGKDQDVLIYRDEDDEANPNVTILAFVGEEKLENWWAVDQVENAKSIVHDFSERSALIFLEENITVK